VDDDDVDDLASEVEAVRAGNESERAAFVINFAQSLQDAEQGSRVAPVPVIGAISELHGEDATFILAAACPTLAEYVWKVTRLDDRATSAPLFVARDSGMDRCTQLYCCGLHDAQDCPAFFKIKMHQSGMQLGIINSITTMTFMIRDSGAAIAMSHQRQWRELLK
jgi:hypothetical protein